MFENKGSGWWPPLPASVFKSSNDAQKPYGIKGAKKVTGETRRYASRTFKQTTMYAKMFSAEK